MTVEKTDLKVLLENSVLSDETKQSLTEAFDAAILLKESEIRADYESKLEENTKALEESAVAMIEEAVADHIGKFSDEIAHARTLEVQYADKLEVFKESYAQKAEETINVLVAEAVAEEIEELKEGIEIAKKNQFMLNVFESFKETYEQLFGGVDGSTIAELKEAKQELATMKRKQKLDQVLESLTGQKRKVAMTVLENVELDKIEEKFAQIKPLLIAESEKPAEAPIEESAVNKDDKEIKGTIVLESAEEDIKSTELTPAQLAAQKRIQKSLNAAKR